MSSVTSSEHRTEGFRYLDRDGELVAGVVWCPGPGSRTVWVLPEPGARATDAVVVKLAKRLKGGGFEGEHRQVGGHPVSDGRWIGQAARLDNRYAPKLSEADWRAVVGPVDQLALPVEDAA